MKNVEGNSFILILPAHSDAPRSVCVALQLNGGFCPSIKFIARSSGQLPRPSCKTDKSATNARIILFNNSFISDTIWGVFFLLRHTPLYDVLKEKIWPLFRFQFLPIISSLQFSLIKKAQLQIWIKKATVEITREHNVLGTKVYLYYDFLQAKLWVGTCETCLGINQRLGKVTPKTVRSCWRFLIGMINEVQLCLTPQQSHV